MGIEQPFYNLLFDVKARDLEHVPPPERLKEGLLKMFKKFEICFLYTRDPQEREGDRENNIYVCPLRKVQTGEKGVYLIRL